MGTLADFLEVSGEHEGVVDEFLRDELNYVVVEKLACRRRGRARAEVGVDGRATFLIHPTAHRHDLFNDDARRSLRGPGVTPLKDAVKRAQRIRALA